MSYILHIFRKEEKKGEENMFTLKTAKKKAKRILITLAAATILVSGNTSFLRMTGTTVNAADLSQIPNYTGNPYTIVNDNEPEFDESDFTTEAFETYSDLDNLGRCGVAYANICKELMPTEKRGKIGMIKPSGWHTVKYPEIIKDRYLYNRCHLIGFQLAGENANEKNLITGTRYLNVDGMLPFEDEIADYVNNTGNHVLYRVTPVFDGDNLIASGVQMEAESVEDSGEGVKFNVYCYNVQPGIGIDYATGDSWADQKPVANGESEDNDSIIVDSNDEAESNMTAEETEYVINTNTGKFHRPNCDSVTKMKAKNKKEFIGSREELISDGYEPCGNCKP